MAILPFLAPSAVASQVAAATAVATAGGMGGTMAAMAPVIMSSAGASAGLGMTTMAIGGGLSALQSLGSASYQSSVAKAQAGQAGIAARQAELDGRSQAVAQMRRSNTEKAELTAYQYAVGAGTGSHEAVRKDADSAGRFDRDMTLLSSRITSEGHRGRQSLYNSKASFISKQGKKDAFGTLFRTGAGLQSEYGVGTKIMKGLKRSGTEVAAPPSLDGIGDYLRRRN